MFLRQLLLLLFALLLCNLFTTQTLARASEERVPTLLSLKGALQDPKAEISSATWHQGHLLLMPQYPDWKNEARLHPAALFALPEQDIIKAVLSARDGEPHPMAPREIGLAGLEACTALPGYEGFEAITTQGDTAFLSIEARHEQSMRSYLVKGRFRDFQSSNPVLELDCTNHRQVDTPVNLRNMSFESILSSSDTLYLFYEANGRNVNSTPQVLLFDMDLNPAGTLPFPPLEYRISDVSNLETTEDTPPKKYFWGLNFFWPGERKLLKPADDPIAATWGRGTTHAASEVVERILRFELTEEGVQLTQQPSIEISLGIIPRNWEGLALLRNPELQGLLLVTDKYPGTILAFISLP